jgi:hypothetical protein
MNNLFNLILQNNYLLWLGGFLIAFVLHEFEEWNIMRWYRRNYAELPPITERAVRVWIIFVNSLAVLWYLAAVVSGNPQIAAFILLPAVAIAVQNALQHVYWLFYFRQYAPGVMTAAILLIPLGVTVAVQGVLLGYVPGWYVGILALMMLPGLLQTVKAGNRLTPFIRAIHQFSINLTKTIYGTA